MLQNSNCWFSTWYSPQDNNDSQLHSEALLQQTNELNKYTRHTSSDVYIDSDSGDEQYSINSKETSFDSNSKTHSPSSHIEVPTSDLPCQYPTSSSSPSSSLTSSSSSSSSPSSLVSTNPQNPDPISNLTNRLSNISLEDLSQSPENLKFKNEQLVTFYLEKEPYTVEILDTAGTATGKYKNHINVEYKEPSKYVNNQASVNFDKVDNLKLFDSTEEIFLVEDECFQTAKQAELSSWKQDNVYTEVPYTGQKLISLK